MALTRRSVRFAALATAIEQRLEDAGLCVAAELVDTVLNEQIANLGALLGVTARTALYQAPADLPDIVARAIVLAAIEANPPPPRAHLRVVE